MNASRTLNPDIDGPRLATLRARVLAVLQQGGWYTDYELQRVCGGSVGGVGAKRRDLRKAEFGGHEIESRRRGDPARALWEYHIIVPRPGGVQLTLLEWTE